MVVRVEEQLCPKLLYEVFVAVLNHREVQGVKGLMVGGVLAEYDPAHSLLHSPADSTAWC